MTVWRAYWRLARYRSRLMVFYLCTTILLWVLPFVPPLIVRQVFNALTGRRAVDSLVWALIALMLLPTVAYVASWFTVVTLETVVVWSGIDLLRTNLLSCILQRPGARALTTSPGDVVGRFSEDTVQPSSGLMFFAGATAGVVATTEAIVILLHISVFITVFVFLPLVAIIITAKLTLNRLEGFRRTTRTSCWDSRRRR